MGTTEATVTTGGVIYDPNSIGFGTGYLVTNNGLGSAQSSALAGYGILKSYSYGTSGIFDNFVGAGWGGAIALFQDTWKIDVPSLNGQTGTIMFSFNADGTISETAAHPGVNNGASWEVYHNNTLVGQSWDFAHNT